MQWTEPSLLIADDDRDFRESLGEVFARRGFRTQLAADGCEAVSILRADTQIHLLVFDVHMPRLSGLEALVQIRQVIESKLPCILMSAALNEQIVRQAEQLDTTSLLSKPFTLRDITGAVEQIFRQSYGWNV